jgi:hypothetical protein
MIQALTSFVSPLFNELARPFNPNGVAYQQARVYEKVVAAGDGNDGLRARQEAQPIIEQMAGLAERGIASCVIERLDTPVRDELRRQGYVVRSVYAVCSCDRTCDCQWWTTTIHLPTNDAPRDCDN